MIPSVRTSESYKGAKEILVSNMTKEQLMVALMDSIDVIEKVSDKLGDADEVISRWVKSGKK